ncbi:sigma-70 family RNA polymerase sigma factor [Phaeodactylibacter sp.]|uniref:RNA polymerase sigma factor n=1 Tax=Phaeodactylibacter sp. TaxID=1940289 RepID=UPI0025F80A2B|nr:sigma-70 family RNA polymerase sigma factor [Phaeodactylibacter sp.]MCI4648010.1 sigma-70 family RNA polymerase sigma factor [Phaeodactylibacter sp.]MCI5093447.1 sigma-70 family RNA polymerase sigma factor [Phaeodactylibacter sp.]
MNDVQLWDALRQGKKSALEAIYRREVVDLFRYGRRIIDDEALVEDVIQDLFIGLWRRRDGLGATDSIRRYLFVALRRDLIRRNTRLRRITGELDETSLEEETVTSIDADIIEAESQELRSARLKEAMKQLSKRQQEVLYLKYFQQMDYHTIAEVLEINYQSVRNVASAGLKALRKLTGLLFLLWWL